MSGQGRSKIKLVVLIVEEFFFRKSIEKLSKIPIYPG